MTLRKSCVINAFLVTLNDVPGHVLRIVGTGKGSKQILNQFLLSKRADPLVECFAFDAKDEIEQPGGQVLAANQPTSLTTNALNQHLL